MSHTPNIAGKRFETSDKSLKPLPYNASKLTRSTNQLATRSTNSYSTKQIVPRETKSSS